MTYLLSSIKQRMLWGIESLHWINILSWDTALIAVVWQELAAEALGISLGCPQRIILGLSVWLAYLGDRWFDVRAIAIENIKTRRHLFIFKWRHGVLPAFLCVLALDVILALRYLNIQTLSLGIVLLLITIFYTCKIARNKRRSRHWLLSKESFVACMFTMGVYIFLINSENVTSLPFWISAAFFCFLCFANLGLISHWELDVDRRQRQSSLAQYWSRSYAFFKGMAFVVGILGIIGFWGITNDINVFLGAIGISGMNLFALHYFRRHLDKEALRVGADLCLLVNPFVLGVFI